MADTYLVCWALLLASYKPTVDLVKSQCGETFPPECPKLSATSPEAGHFTAAINRLTSWHHSTHQSHV